MTSVDTGKSDAKGINDTDTTMQNVHVALSFISLKLFMVMCI